MREEIGSKRAPTRGGLQKYEDRARDRFLSLCYVRGDFGVDPDEIRSSRRHYLKREMD